MGGAERNLFQKEKNMKTLSFITVIAALMLGACSPLQVSDSEGEQPTPVIVTELVPTEEPVPTEKPASVGADVDPMNGYQPVRVVDVFVEVGQGSPVPVSVDIGADLLDRCGQVEFVEVVQNEAVFKIFVGTIPSTEPFCLEDTPSFRMKVPLNVGDLPVGTYFVEVNGVRADFDITDSASTATDLRNADTPFVERDVLVDDVSIEVGRGSPLPVHAVVSANLPNGCSQLGRIQIHREGNTFYVRLGSTMPAQTECNPDALPARIEIPLSIITLPEGTYEVNVNGTTGSFNIPIY